MTSTRHLVVPASSSSRRLQVGGFLLAALLALIAPGTTDHVDAVFDRHFHDPVTRGVVPLIDTQGHAHQMAPDEVAAQAGHLAASPGLTGFAADRVVPDLPEVSAPGLISLPQILSAPLRLTGHPIGPTPPPPRW